MINSVKQFSNSLINLPTDNRVTNQILDEEHFVNFIFENLRTKIMIPSDDKTLCHFIHFP